MSREVITINNTTTTTTTNFESEGILFSQIRPQFTSVPILVFNQTPSYFSTAAGRQLCNTAALDLTALLFRKV